MESFKWRLLLVGALLLSFGAVIYFSRPQPAVVHTVESSVSTSRAVSTKNSVTTSTRTTKPDGTIVEQKQTIRNSIKEKEKRVEVKKDSTVTAPAAPKSRYRIGADWLPSTDRPPTVKDSELRAGARLGDSNVWIEGGYDFKHGQAKIGLSLEF